MMRVWVSKELGGEQIILSKPFNKVNVTVIAGDKQYTIEEHRDFYSVAEMDIRPKEVDGEPS